LTRLVSHASKLLPQKVYKQEKDQRSNRRPGPPLSLSSESDPSFIPPRGSPRRPSILPVDSIKEDDEESPIKPLRTRQTSVSNPPKSSTSSSSRVRSFSTSGVTPRILRRLSRTTTPPVTMLFTNPIKVQNHPIAKGQGHDHIPPQTRTVQQKQESTDIEDEMGESDDENFVPVKQKNIVTSPSRPRQQAVSANTRDLIDFLAQGPPDTGVRDVSGLFADNNHAAEPGKSKGSRRLQKMISKLSLGGGEKSRGSHDDLSKTKTPQSPSRPYLDTKLSSLANRPIPPRLPRSISPPPSPSLDSFEEQSYISSRPRSASVRRKKQDSLEAPRSEPSPPVPALSPRDLQDQSFSIPTNVNGHSKYFASEELPKDTTLPAVNVFVNGDASATYSSLDTPQNRVAKIAAASPTKPVSPTRFQARKPAPVYGAPPAGLNVRHEDARDIHHLMSRATSADECRLIFDMFLAKSGIKVEADGGGSSPLPPAAAVRITPADTPLEHSLVELLLGGAEPVSEFGVHEQQASEESKAPAVLTPRGHGIGTPDESSSTTEISMLGSDRRLHDERMGAGSPEMSPTTHNHTSASS